MAIPELCTVMSRVEVRVALKRPGSQVVVVGPLCLELGEWDTELIYLYLVVLLIGSDKLVS